MVRGQRVRTLDAGDLDLKPAAFRHRVPGIHREVE
jgi:hypothetical protein